MAATSTMLPLGTSAPDFQLPDPTGRLVSRDDFAGSPALLVVFLSNHCPYVKHVAAEIGRVGAEYGPRGVSIVAIGSNDVTQQSDDTAEASVGFAQQHGFTFPYLRDDDQSVARAYQAACTPDFFVFDADRRLVYRGQLDDARPSNAEPVDGHDLRAALDATLEGSPVAEDQVASMGCSIKWKPGNEPEYANLVLLQAR